MAYNFDTQVNRRGTNSLKWDVPEEELPMWVADMDFRTAPEIIAALQQRVEHGVFGYTSVPNEWYQAIIGWWKRRHNMQIEKDWLAFCTGVVPAVSSVVRKLTTVAEYVVVQTPVYNIFFNSIENNGRRILESPLVYHGTSYEIDFDDLEEKLAAPQTTMMILCNPHNPVGRIWRKEELEKIGALCWKHHVIVLADEIHCDLTDPGSAYIPFASVSPQCRDNSITCIAPTKAFNIAGLQSAAVMVPNEALRRRVIRGLNTDEVAEPNAFAVTAAVAAFREGESWLDALREYLLANKRLAEDFLRRELPEIHAVPSKATYLLWLDCSNLAGSATELSQFLRKTVGLHLSDGSQYGKAGRNFMRMNLACPQERLEDGLDRLKRGVIQYEQYVERSC